MILRGDFSKNELFEIQEGLGFPGGITFPFIFPCNSFIAVKAASIRLIALEDFGVEYNFIKTAIYKETDGFDWEILFLIDSYEHVHLHVFEGDFVAFVDLQFLVIFTSLFELVIVILVEIDFESKKDENIV